MAVAESSADDQPDHGEDLAAASICTITPTKCQARTRVYSGGKLVAQGFPVDDISEHLKDENAVIWLDLLAPDRSDLAVLSEEFGLHPLAIEDAWLAHERPKIDRYRSHLFLAAYSVHLDSASGELTTSELAAFVTSRALITVRKDEGMNIGAVVSLLGRQPRPCVRGRRLSPARPARQHRGRLLLRRAVARR